MYARNVSMHLKSITFTEFNRTFNSEVVPLLRKQKGFRDAIMLVTPGEKEVQAISFWDEKENATASNTTGYPASSEELRETHRGNASGEDV